LGFALPEAPAGYINIAAKRLPVALYGCMRCFRKTAGWHC